MHSVVPSSLDYPLKSELSMFYVTNLTGKITVHATFRYWQSLCNPIHACNLLKVTITVEQILTMCAKILLEVTSASVYLDLNYGNQRLAV